MTHAETLNVLDEVESLVSDQIQVDSMVNQKTVLAVTDDMVLPISSVLTIMKELGKEMIERCGPLITTHTSTIRWFGTEDLVT